jgi:type I restriction enzyme, S subunit
MSNYPNDWRVETIGDICEIHDSKRIPLSSEQRRDRKGPYPYYGANNIQDSIDDFIFDFDAVLLAEDGGYYDEYETRDIAQYATGRYWVNNHAHILTGNESLDTRFLYFSLVRKNICPWINTGTRAKLNQADLRQIEIAVPPLPEQKKIAEILSGIDRSIEARRSSIHKTHSIMNAMKEDLMAGAEDWEEHELGKLLAFRNGLNTEKDNFGQGVPFVSYKNVYSGGIVTTKNLTQKVSLSAVEEERFSLRSGDILFTRTSETPDEIGFSCVFDDRHGSAVFNGFCIRGRPLEEGILMPGFASFFLRSESVLSQMRFLCKYTTRAGISAESLSKVRVRIPNPKTQQQLADSLIAVRQSCSTQDKSVRHLIDIKKSVSSDLLSGRKRVKV